MLFKFKYGKNEASVGFEPMTSSIRIRRKNALVH